MEKLKRVELVNKIVDELSLSPGKRTLGYFTRQQLMELYIKTNEMKGKQNEEEEN